MEAKKTIVLALLVLLYVAGFSSSSQIDYSSGLEIMEENVSSSDFFVKNLADYDEEILDNFNFTGDEKKSFLNGDFDVSIKKGKGRVLRVLLEEKLKHIQI